MHDVLALKTCRDCLRELPLDQFHKAAGCKDGLRSTCKTCVHEKRVQYYAVSSDKNREYSRQYYIANSHSVKKYQQEYSQQNRPKIARRNKVWRVANRERLLKAKQDYYEQNKERLKPFYKAYHSLHPEYNKATTLRRRARLRNAAGDCSAKQWLDKCAFFGWRCYLCHDSLAMKSVHMDHRVPLSRGGSNWPANLAPACGPCNLSKSNKTEAEFKTHRDAKLFVSNNIRLCP